MTNPILNRHQQDDNARASGTSIHHSFDPQLTPAETELTAFAPQEVLVADARSGRTPSQMVEQKLVALLGSEYSGLFRHATSRRGNIRGLPAQ